MSNKIRIAILTNILPIYRKSFYEKIFNYKDLSIKVYCQDSLKGIDLKLIHNDFNPSKVTILPRDAPRSSSGVTMCNSQ